MAEQRIRPRVGEQRHQAHNFLVSALQESHMRLLQKIKEDFRERLEADPHAKRAITEHLSAPQYCIPERVSIAEERMQATVVQRVFLEK